MKNDIVKKNKNSNKSKILIHNYKKYMEKYVSSNDIKVKENGTVMDMAILLFLLYSLLTLTLGFIALNLKYSFKIIMDFNEAFGILTFACVLTFILGVIRYNFKSHQMNQIKNMIRKINNNDFSDYMIKRRFLDSIFPNNNIEKENEVMFYELLNEGILNNDERLFDIIDNLKFDFSITNKQIKDLSEIREKEKINNKITQFQSIKTKYFHLLKDATNENLIYNKINNHLMNNPYDIELNEMLDEFLNNSQYFKTINRYDYLMKVIELNKAKLKQDEIDMLETIKNKFNNEDFQDILMDIRKLTIQIEDKI